jgi:hypothetical protein
MVIGGGTPVRCIILLIAAIGATVVAAPTATTPAPRRGIAASGKAGRPFANWWLCALQNPTLVKPRRRERLGYPRISRREKSGMA